MGTIEVFWIYLHLWKSLSFSKFSLPLTRMLAQEFYRLCFRRQRATHNWETQIALFPGRRENSCLFGLWSQFGALCGLVKEIFSVTIAQHATISVLRPWVNILCCPGDPLLGQQRDSDLGLHRYTGLQGVLSLPLSVSFLKPQDTFPKLGVNCRK